MLNVPPCWSLLIVADVDSMRTATFISESAHVAESDGDGPALGGDDGDEGGPDTVDGGAVDGSVLGELATVDGGWVEDPDVGRPRPDAWDAPEPPQEFAMTRITTSNPTTTTARRRQ